MATEHEHTSADGRDVSLPTGTEFEQATEDGEPAELGLDTVFGALKNARRRRVLRYLNEQNDRVVLSDLAEHIAAIENDTTPEALDSKQRKRVYVGLYQAHLPKLDSMGVLTFDRQSGLIERTPAASQLEKYLDYDDSNTRFWERYQNPFQHVSTIKSKLTSIVSRLQPSDSNEPEDGSSTNPLHECPECSTVYLSESSRTCSNCNSMTAPIQTAD